MDAALRQGTIYRYTQSVLEALTKLDEFPANDETVSVLKSIDSDLWGLIDFLEEDEDDEETELPPVPDDFPVKVLGPDDEATNKATNKATCGTCGRSWDDAIVTGWTPAPSGRCPFEYFHKEGGSK